MTVAQLIEELKKMPQDTPVICSTGSDWEDVSGLTLYSKESQTVAWYQPRNGYMKVNEWDRRDDRKNKVTRDYRTVVEIDVN